LEDFLDPLFKEIASFSKEQWELLLMITSSYEIHVCPFKLCWIQNEEISAMRLFPRVASDFHFPLIYKGFVPFGTFYLLYEVFYT